MKKKRNRIRIWREPVLPKMNRMTLESIVTSKLLLETSRKTSKRSLDLKQSMMKRAC